VDTAKDRNLPERQIFPIVSRYQPPSKGEKSELWDWFLAHHPPCKVRHTFRIRIARTSIDVRPRSLGQWTEILLSIGWYLTCAPPPWEVAESLLVIALLPLPITLDWITRIPELGDSTRTLRLLTDFSRFPNVRDT
jgi:hypothetical protein